MKMNLQNFGYQYAQKQLESKTSIKFESHELQPRLVSINHTLLNANMFERRINIKTISRVYIYFNGSNFRVCKFWFYNSMGGKYTGK